MFEMHPIWALANNIKEEYEKPRKHWEWLKQPHDFPIYMLEHRPEVPACVPYPLVDVAKDLFGERLLKGGEPTYVFGSSIDYMMALAIHMRPKQIELYGIEMGSSTEYRYQRESMALMIGMALSRGIKVIVPDDSILLVKTKLYGYEGGQMIFRQDAERLYEQARKTKDDEMAKLQFMEGRRANQLEMELFYKDDAKKAELETKFMEQRDRAIYAEALMNSLEFIIREMDGEEVDIEVKNPLRKVSIREKNG